jgi:hypothetical protein
MKFSTRAILVASLLTLSAPAFAADGGLFIEPSLTYETSDAKIDYPTGFSNSSGSANGAGIGLRVGGHVADILFVGADLRYSKPTYKDSTVNSEAASSAYNYAPVVGVQTPLFGIRVWGAYVLGGELAPEEDKGVQMKFSDPKGYRIGAGIHFLLVSINLEYQDLKYDKTTLEKAGPLTGIDMSGNKLTNKSYIVSVSMPIAL